MRQIDLRQGHRPPSGIYFHRYGGDVPRRDALCARTRGHPFGNGRRGGRRTAAAGHLHRFPLQSRTRGQRHLCRRRPRRGQDPHDRGEQLRERRQFDLRGARQTGGHAAADGAPAGRGDGRPRHRYDGLSRRRAENLHDGPAFGAGAPPLRRAAGQRRRGLLRGDSAKRPLARQGRHDAGDFAAAQG